MVVVNQAVTFFAINHLLLTHQIEGRVELDGLAEDSQADVEGAVGTMRRPGMNGLVAVVFERPGFQRVEQPTERIRHIAEHNNRAPNRL